RRFTPRIDRLTMSVEGTAYAESSDRELAYFLHELLQVWRRPDSTIVRAHRGSGEVWKDPTASVNPHAKCIGPVWIGAGRHLAGDKTVIGPAIVWDDPAHRPDTEA